MQDHNHVEATYTLDRRTFLATIGATCSALAVPLLETDAAESKQLAPRKKEGATVRAAFLYPPSTKFSDDVDGWWSWPGNEFDAEGRQKSYTAALKEIEKRLGMKITTENRSVANNEDAQRLIREIETTRPDGLLLIMFYNRSLPQVDMLLEAAQKLRAYPNNPLYCGRLQSPMPALSAKNVLNVEKTTPPSIFGLPPWPRTFRSAS